MTDEYIQADEPTSDESEGATLGPRDVLVAVRRRWWLIATVLVAVCAFGAWSTLRKPRIYRAAVTVRVQPEQTVIPMAQGATPYDWNVNRLVTEQHLVKSEQIAQRVVDDVGLRLTIVRPERLLPSRLFSDDWPRVDSSAVAREFRLKLGDRQYSLASGGVTYGSARYGDTLVGGGVRLVVPDRPEIGTSDVVLALSRRVDAAAAVRGAIATRILPQTDIVEITYEGVDPVLVRDAANAIAREYQTFSGEAQRSRARGKSDYILQAQREQEQRLLAAQESLRQFKEQKGVLDVSAEQEALLDQLSGFEAERTRVQNEQEVYRKLIGSLAAADTVDEQLRRLAGTGALEKNAQIAPLYAQWFDLSRERSRKLTSGLGPGHDDVKAIDHLITDTKEQLRDASLTYLKGVESRLGSLNVTLATLRGRLDRYPPLEAEQLRLQSNVKTAQTMYDALQSEYQLARIAEVGDGGNVRIIDPATLPTFAVAPNRKRAAFFYVVVGLLLGVGLAVLLERLDDSVKSPDELRDRFQLSVLGLIPEIDAADAKGAQASLGGRLVTHVDPRSAVAESYRSLRTNLAFARAHRDLRTIVLTSPGPSDGKSTTVANLAITFAQQGQRTLLVDADMRRAVLDKTFKVPRSPGLTDVILGTSKIGDAAHETEVPNLFVLGSGQFPPNPSELLGSPAMQRVLREATDSFDLVLFDSPPLLAVTDAAVLSTMVDGTILIVRMSATAREAVRRAMMQLRAVRARVLGAVLNDVNFRTGSYYGGYGYYYYSYYGQESNGNGRHHGVLDRLREFAGRGSGSR